MHTYQISPLTANLWPQVVALADRNIGRGYLTKEAMSFFLNLSTDKGKNVSFVLVDSDQNVHGLRLTFAPGKWLKSMNAKTHPELWRSSPLATAYFKTILIDETLRGKGLGPQMTAASIAVLKELGTEAIVCHSWKESPNNSSQKYLITAGFEPLHDIPNFWQDVDYECVICQPQTCSCTAVEMIKYLN